MPIFPATMTADATATVHHHPTNTTWPHTQGAISGRFLSRAMSLRQRPAVLLTAAVLLLATLMGATASQTAQATPTAAIPQPSYSLYDGYWVLRDFGVPGTEDQVAALLHDTCARMSNDQPSMLALQKQLNLLYPNNGGDVMAIANDVYCPQFGDALHTLAASEIGH